MDACREREAGWEVTGVPGTKNFCHGQNRPYRAGPLIAKT